MNLDIISDDIVLEEAKRREHEIGTPAPKPKAKLRKCRGCGKKFNAREMRSHPCSIGWTKRLPYVMVKNQNGSISYILEDKD